MRVRAAGLDPMDWGIAARPEVAAAFGIILPAGFGSDFAGVVEEVGEGAAVFAVGDRAVGAAIGRAVADADADAVIVAVPDEPRWHTPDGISDEVASTLLVAGLTPSAAVSAVSPAPGDTLLGSISSADSAPSRCATAPDSLPAGAPSPQEA